MARRFLLLWDLDLTIIYSGGVDHEAWQEVCSQLSGQPSTDSSGAPGRTDPMILLETLVKAGVSEEKAKELLPTALSMEVPALASREALLRERGKVMPGAEAALSLLSQDDGLTQAPVTGNVSENAALKLKVFGLARYLALDLGAYGSDSWHRPTLVQLARERASAEFSQAFDRSNTALVGDSVFDIVAALEGGARPIGVASGRTSADELAQAGAEVVLPDLTNPQLVRETLVG